MARVSTGGSSYNFSKIDVGLSIAWDYKKKILISQISMDECLLHNKTLDTIEEWKNCSLILQNRIDELEFKLDNYIPLYYRYLLIDLLLYVLKAEVCLQNPVLRHVLRHSYNVLLQNKMHLKQNIVGVS
jgi:hypothetical protein